MHLDECLELTKKYSKCPKCGSNKIGGGEGGLLVEDLTFDRWCKCGWKVQVKYKKVIKE